MTGIDVIVPCKGLSSGKQRLAVRFAPAARRRVNEWFLARTVEALIDGGLKPARCVVVSADPDARAAAQAKGLGAVVEPPGFGLNAAIALAQARRRDNGAMVTLVIPVDLPFADGPVVRTLIEQAVAAVDRGSILIVADRAGAGTNALAVPAAVPFEFGFGPASLLRHYEEAARHELGVERFVAPALAFDVDTLGDFVAWSSDRRFPRALRDAAVSRSNG